MGSQENIHHLVWENNLEVLKKVLEAAGAAAEQAQDKESGWTPLHCALYYGHIRAALLLLVAGVQTSLQDFKGREGLDIVSARVDVEAQQGCGTIVYSWGSGTNYQLGTGAVSRHEPPVRIDELTTAKVVGLAAAKFHSSAWCADGRLFTWGHGRGGRLGHPDFDIHCGEAAVIKPRQVHVGRLLVVGVAAAKHHMLAVTRCGSVFSWGCNRDGRLGYLGVDTQPTPRRVASIKQRGVAVAAANRHSACLTDGGQLYTWGCNLHGQLGYGTYDSASNAVPKIVDAFKDRPLKQVSVAKRHTVALTPHGDVFTWGHRQVTPRRVTLPGTRDFSQTRPGVLGVAQHVTDVMPRVVMVAAGAAHTSAITDRGVLLSWCSALPHNGAREVTGLLSGKQAVHVSAGKYRTAVVTADGDVYMWEGWSKQSESCAADNLVLNKKAKALETISPERVDGVRRAQAVAVGEKHSLCLQTWNVPPLDDAAVSSTQALLSSGGQQDTQARLAKVASLQRLCEETVARTLVDPRSAVHILEFADTAGAHTLKHFCLSVVVDNLVLVLQESLAALEQLPEHLLEEIEVVLRSRNPRPSAAPLRVSFSGSAALQHVPQAKPVPLSPDGSQQGRLFHHEREINDALIRARLVRQTEKKLQQVHMLEMRERADQVLDPQQQAKLKQKNHLLTLQSMLAADESLPTILALISSQRMASFGDLEGLSPKIVSELELQKDGSRKARRRRSGKGGKGLSAQQSPGGSPEGVSMARGTSSLPASLVTHPLQPMGERSTSHSPSAPLENPTPGPSEPATGPVLQRPLARQQGFADPNPVPGLGKAPSAAASRKPSKQGRKGALSAFLAGNLEKPASVGASTPPESATPSPQPGAGRSWRTPASLSKHVSLLNIQSEEAATKAAGSGQVQAPKITSRGARRGSESPAPAPSPSDLDADPAFRVSIADLVAAKRSAPIPLTASKGRGPASAGGSVWGTSPPVTAPHSLRSIQAEQLDGQFLGKVFGESPRTPAHALAHTSSWRERRTSVTAGGASPGGGFQVLGSSPGALFHRSPAV